MRIISGSKKGHRISFPKKLPVRPTTDFCKESIFNIIENNFNIDNIDVLDLFSGSGSISFEFASRGANKIIVVDKNFGCYSHIKSETAKLEFTNIKVIKADALKYLNKCTEKFDIIFADPPYNFTEYDFLIENIFSQNLLTQNGWFILEHADKYKASNHAMFSESRKYGQSIISILKNEQK